MRIAFVDPLGLTYDGSTLSKRGLGGSESAVIRMSVELDRLGFDVTVFNDCTSDDSRLGLYDGVRYIPISDVNNEPQQPFDVVIVSRSVKPFLEQWKVLNGARHTVLWMHDTFCDGDNEIENLVVSGRINEIFTLSDWHTFYVSTCNHGKHRNPDILKKHIFQTRNGIGNMDIGFVDVQQKDPNLFVYNASITKGMVPLVKDIWPRIKQRIPDAHLKVIGGYYRFRSDHGPDQQELDWRKMVEDHPEIEFTGVIPQQIISNILRKASFMIYPTAFPETFGISTLEALAHNVPLLTCQFGALEETAIDLASYKLPYPVEPNFLHNVTNSEGKVVSWLNREDQINKFVDMVVSAHDNKYLHQQKMYACNQVKDICTWDTVALQWKQHLYKKLGLFMDIDEYRTVTRINTQVRKVFGRRFVNYEELLAPKQPLFNEIVVVTPVYNAREYIDKCILSVAQQDYNNYQMYIVDDCSTDDTVEVAKTTIKSLPSSIRSRFTVIENKKNKGALYNQIRTAESRSGIIMLLDGDDWLVNDPSIFDLYNNLYNDGAEFTYGSCWSLADNIPLIAQEYPPEVKVGKTYRQHKFNWNMPYTHLRTFSSDLLFSHLYAHGYHDFKDENGKWLKAGGDTAIFYALIEMAEPERVVCVSDIVYNYNDLNPINDYKVNSNEQTINAQYVLSKASVFPAGEFDLRNK